MSSGWEVYYVIFLSGAFALIFPLVLSLVSRFFAPRSVPRKPARSQKADPVQGRFLQTKFYLVFNASTLLLVMAFVLIPCVVTFQELLGEPGARELLQYGVFIILSVSILISIALLYAVRKGDLTWLSGKGRSGLGLDDQ